MKAGPALRVAAITTLLFAGVYLAAAVVVFVLTSAQLTAKTDGRLSRLLSIAQRDPRRTASETGPNEYSTTEDDPDAGPVYLWIFAKAVTGGRVVIASSASAPTVPPGILAHLPAPGIPVTASLGHASPYRLLTAQNPAGELMAGISTAGSLHTEHLLLDGEFVAGPVLLLAMFGGSLAVGMRALAPVEQARQRQLEFTADASHELRTPVSVLRAEVDVALSAPRTVAAYQDSLLRIRAESDRLRRLVDDLLWLARFDSQPPPQAHEPVDLVTLAVGGADRFRSVGPAITADVSDAPALITAPPELIDRLIGVLMDNACRYAGPSGRVRISVQAESTRVALIVEDSGPGISEALRHRLFDRFQRAEQTGGGAGLGLAIGDSIARSTGGRWRIGGSSLGGAALEVSWRRPRRLS